MPTCKKYFTFLAIGGLLLLPTGTTFADTVKVPVMEQGGETTRTTLPRSGESQDSVRQRFGNPLTERGPVGDPPISLWTYSDFTVYFEYQHVVHSVVNPKKR